MRRCVLVLAAAAAFDDVPFELRDVYGPPPAKAAVELPLLLSMLRLRRLFALIAALSAMDTPRKKD